MTDDQHAVPTSKIHSESGAEAVEEIRLARLDELSAYLEAKYGPVPEELIQEAMRE